MFVQGWGLVLDQIANISLSKELYFDLFEHIFYELIELNEIDCAKELLYKSVPLIKLKNENKDRWDCLNYFIFTPDKFNPNEYYKYNNKTNSRIKLINDINKELIQIQPSRLLSIITQSLKYQKISGVLSRGSTYNLLNNDKAMSKYSINEKVIHKYTNIIEFGNNTPLCCMFSPNGEHLVTGSSDGFIEIWDYNTGKLRSDIVSQKNNELMLHSENVGITCINFSNDNELLITGGNDGSIKIWKLYLGKCVCEFKNAHDKGITSVMFNNDGTQILSSGLDGDIKIYGLKSKRILKTFHKHTSFVNKAIYSGDYNRVISCGSDGLIIIWDIKNEDAIRIIKNINCMKIKSNNSMNKYLNEMYGDISTNENKSNDNDIDIRMNENKYVLNVKNIILNPNKKDEIYIIINDLIVYIINIESGKLVGKIENKKLIKKCSDIDGNGNISLKNNWNDISLSFNGGYIYCLNDQNILYCFNTQNNKLVNLVKLHNKPVLGITHHPHINIIASFSQDKTVKIWRA